MKAIVGRVDNCQGRQATPHYTCGLQEHVTRLEPALAFALRSLQSPTPRGTCGIFFHWNRTRTNSIAFANISLLERQLEALPGQKPSKPISRSLSFRRILGA
jgi:hypothetical protein